jgi:hypothetical protein
MGVPAAGLPAPLGATATLPNSPGPRSFGHPFPLGRPRGSPGVAAASRAPDLTVLTEGATKCADTLTVDSSERSHEAALEQVHRETRRLRNSLDGGGRHDICTHHGVRQLIPQRGPAMRRAPRPVRTTRAPRPSPFGQPPPPTPDSTWSRRSGSNRPPTAYKVNAQRRTCRRPADTSHTQLAVCAPCVHGWRDCAPRVIPCPPHEAREWSDVEIIRSAEAGMSVPGAAGRARPCGCREPCHVMPRARTRGISSVSEPVGGRLVAGSGVDRSWALINEYETAA